MILHFLNCSRKLRGRRDCKGNLTRRIKPSIKSRNGWRESLRAPKSAICWNADVYSIHPDSPTSRVRFLSRHWIWQETLVRTFMQWMPSTCWRSSPRPNHPLTLNLHAIQLAESSGQEKARNWLGSLYNNTGWSYHDMGEYEKALEIFQKAEAFRSEKGSVPQIRIARWCVARTLRSLNRVEEAISKQMELKEELDSAGENDGYVLEEIGECLLLLNRAEEARPFFARAHEQLSQDPWLSEKESSESGTAE